MPIYDPVPIYYDLEPGRRDDADPCRCGHARDQHERVPVREQKLRCGCCRCDYFDLDIDRWRDRS